MKKNSIQKITILSYILKIENCSVLELGKTAADSIGDWGCRGPRYATDYAFYYCIAVFLCRNMSDSLTGFILGL